MSRHPLLSFILLLSSTPVLGQQSSPSSKEHPLNISANLRLILEGGKGDQLGQSARPALSSRLPNQPHLLLRRTLNGRSMRNVGPTHNTIEMGPVPVIRDATGRLLCRINLDTSLNLTGVRSTIVSSGGRITAQVQDDSGKLIETFLPLEVIDSIAVQPGVISVTAVPRGNASVGRVTSQGVRTLSVPALHHNGVTGYGITVGILSDSWNNSNSNDLQGNSDGAPQDVISRDLPNESSVTGSSGAKFVIESSEQGSDEGRALGQVIHDVAPDADLCFASANDGELLFAERIVRLRDDPACHADVIVDDFSYFDEPFFSDGRIAAAIQKVTTAGNANERQATYFTAAGNNAGQGFSGTLNFVSKEEAERLSSGDVNLDSIPASVDTSGGFQIFGSPSKVQVSQHIHLDGTEGATFDLQWDDPFDRRGGVTTDLTMLFFNSHGEYIGGADSDNDNFATEQPIELFSLLKTPADVRLVLVRKGRGLKLAKLFKYIVVGATPTAIGVSPFVPVVFGHAGAKNAVTVAAYQYNDYPGSVAGRSRYEYFSSTGPFYNSFSEHGERLPMPELRLKPDLSGPDGVNNTFYDDNGGDFEASYGYPDGFPNFFGTSAAAPHIAGVAALLLQAAGGPGSLTPRHMADVLRSTAGPRDVDLYISSGAALTNRSYAALELRGNYLEDIKNDTGEFCFIASDKNVMVSKLVIDMKDAGLMTYPSALPTTISRVRGGATVRTEHAKAITTVVAFAMNNFTSGSCFSFGVARVQVDSSGAPAYYVSADQMDGTTFTVTLSTGVTTTGTLRSREGTGYKVWDGYGPVNALAAWQAIQERERVDPH